jgi:hypothetical protein
MLTTGHRLGRAACLARAAESIVVEAGRTLDREEREGLEATLAASSECVSDAELEALLQEGHRMSSDDAVALALDGVD